MGARPRGLGPMGPGALVPTPRDLGPLGSRAWGHAWAGVKVFFGVLGVPVRAIFGSPGNLLIGEVADIAFAATNYEVSLFPPGLCPTGPDPSPSLWPRSPGALEWRTVGPGPIDPGPMARGPWAMPQGPLAPWASGPGVLYNGVRRDLFFLIYPVWRARTGAGVSCC